MWQPYCDPDHTPHVRTFPNCKVVLPKETAEPFGTDSTDAIDHLQSSRAVSSAVLSAVVHVLT
jgi:hypothetical protein